MDALPFGIFIERGGQAYLVAVTVTHGRFMTMVKRCHFPSRSRKWPRSPRPPSARRHDEDTRFRALKLVCRYQNVLSDLLALDSLNGISDTLIKQCPGIALEFETPDRYPEHGLWKPH